MTSSVLFLGLASSAAGFCMFQACVHPELGGWQRAALAFWGAVGLCLLKRSGQ